LFDNSIRRDVERIPVREYLFIAIFTIGIGLAGVGIVRETDTLLAAGLAVASVGMVALFLSIYLAPYYMKPANRWQAPPGRPVGGTVNRRPVVEGLVRAQPDFNRPGSPWHGGATTILEER
jgi:hypothetical protein